jgi:hypothetical protein
VNARLRQASIHAVEGQSLVIPLIVEGMPESVAVLGRDFDRKREFHLTAVAQRVLQRFEADVPDLWDRVIRTASGRALGPVTVRREVRRVSLGELETLIVMADCPGLAELHADLSDALSRVLRPPPAHVTLYSTDGIAGIGIVDEDELAQRAPALSDREQEAVRSAIRFDEVFLSG